MLYRIYQLGHLKLSFFLYGAAFQGAWLALKTHCYCLDGHITSPISDVETLLVLARPPPPSQKNTLSQDPPDGPIVH